MQSPAISRRGTVAKPVIVSLTGNQVIDEGQVAVFTVVASGSSPLTYQWKRNNNPIVYATSSSLSTGQSGTYTVDVSNPGGTTHSGSTTLTVNPVSTNPPSIPTGGSLSTFGTFDTASPTVIITHGWQPDGDYNTTNPPVDWQTSMAGAIKARLGSNQVNVLLFAWPEAYTHSLDPRPARDATASEGSQLAGALQTRLGSAYQQKIHFVGHSFGTFVNAVAVSKLSQHIGQVSLLDAPINVKAGIVSLYRNDNLFRNLLPKDRIDYVDSYIADSPIDIVWKGFYFTGITFGGFIAGSAPDGGLHLGTDHPGTHFVYLNTIRTSSATLGFNCSILLDSSERQPLDRWNPPVTVSQTLAQFTDAASATFGEVLQDIDNVQGTIRNVFRLRSSGSTQSTMNAPQNQAQVYPGDSAVEFEVAIPPNAQDMHFNFLFSQLGDGDWMTLSFNDEVLYSFLGRSFFSDGYDEAVIPVSNFAGQTGVIRVILHTASSAATEVSVANFHFEFSTPVISSTLGNISTRLSVGTGDNAMIGGFIITGTQPKTLIVRGIGPSLGAFGVPGALADPVIEVHGSSGELLATNDNWSDAGTRQEIINSGLAPTNDLESALWGILNPGAYTVVVRGKDDTTGVGLFEVYDLDQTVDSKLANISTRGFVDTGDNVMIGGTIITGSTSAKVLFRAIGPSLANFGLSNALQDPTLELHDGNGALLAANDNWRSDQEAEILATTIPPTDNRESAILKNLPPGAYTAIVRGTGNSTGVAVVEAYQLNN